MNASMNRELLSSSVTALGGIVSTPGSRRSLPARRSASNRGAGNSGATRISSSGSIGCQTLSAIVMRGTRSEEHTSELQSRGHLVCRLLLEKKNDHHHRYHLQDGTQCTCRH